MTRSGGRSRGADLHRRLLDGVQVCSRAAHHNARPLPILRGLTPKCVFTAPLDTVLCNTADLLVQSNRIYCYGNEIVCEVGDNNNRRLQSLAIDGRVEPVASGVLANLFVCELSNNAPEAAPVQFPPPRQFIELLVNHEPTTRRIPEIRTYSRRPLFDDDFQYRDAGWHPSVGYLIHSPEIEPILPSRLHDNPRDNIPSTLMRVLQDFSLKSVVDLINVVGVLLTGLLIEMFVARGKAVVLLDGNQQGVGKTLLARIITLILDGDEPDTIHFTPNDEELAKRICAGLRERAGSVILIDNAKLRSGDAISSATIESNSVAPRISLRILGKSVNFTRPNDLLWFITMNDTKTSPDLMSRGIPIRFHYDGDPGNRDFGDRNPLDAALRHRHQILGELAGLVIRWNQLGRPRGRCRHRLQFWASTIGGILDANGLHGFLTNLAEANASFNSGLEELAALAEMALRWFPQMIQTTSNQEMHDDSGRS